MIELHEEDDLAPAHPELDTEELVGPEVAVLLFLFSCYLYSPR